MTRYKCTYAEGKTIELTKQEAQTLYKWLNRELFGLRKETFADQNQSNIRKK